MRLFFNNAIICQFALITKKILLIENFNKVTKNRILPIKIAFLFDRILEMINANRSNCSSYSEIKRSANQRPAHIDAEPSEPDLCKWVWGTEHRDHGWRDQVLSCNIFYSSTTTSVR
jgi:hypothetical protein